MLGSTLVGYNYGVSGPFWFAAGCSPMIVFFALLGISCKRKIPEAHTLLEIVKIRYGKGRVSEQDLQVSEGVYVSRGRGAHRVHVFVLGQ